MAININTQDLENFPGNVKRVSIDLESIVPLNEEGDEKFVLSANTSAYSDIAERTSIQDLYVTQMKSGWCKSSGFTGSSGKFYLDSTHNRLKVKVDATTSGTDGLGFYEVHLNYNQDETPLNGEVIADDLEKKIRAISKVLAEPDIGFSNSYRNASVEFKNGRFVIVSGSISPHYSGNNRSAVEVAPADTNDCSEILGFDLPTTSYALSNVDIKETILNTSYTADSGTLSVNSGMGATPGKCFMITDGTNTDYFVSLAGTNDTQIVVPTNSTNGFTGISNDYTANKAKIQMLREQDPESVPTCWYTSIDQLVRFAIKSIANQIDYSD